MQYSQVSSDDQQQEEFTRIKQDFLYFKANGQNQNKNEKSRIKTIIYISLILYTIFMIIILYQLYQDEEFRIKVYEYMKSIAKQNGSTRGAINIGIFGFVIILLGFNVIIYDILGGYLIESYFLAVFTITFAKCLSKYLSFLMGRYCLRKYIYQSLRNNIYFLTCYLASAQQPHKLMILLQFLPILTICKTYGAGFFKLSHFEYLATTIIATLIWVMFWVWVGHKMDSVWDLMQTGDTGKYENVYIKISIFLIMVGLIIYFNRLMRKMYQDLEQEARYNAEGIDLMRIQDESIRLAVNKDEENDN